jgi:hypothetical protein
MHARHLIVTLTALVVAAAPVATQSPAPAPTTLGGFTASRATAQQQL